MLVKFIPCASPLDPEVRQLGQDDSRLTKHAKAAPFKRNDAMLDVLPIQVIVFPGIGIQDNLADKAGRFGIPVVDFPTKRGGE